MEKRYYNFDNFFEIYMRDASVKDGTEAKLYNLNGKIYKIFYSYFEYRNEETIESIGAMEAKYITRPTSLIYLGWEYYGFTMDDAGEDLETILKTQDLSFDKRYEILLQIKEALLYIEQMGTPHGDFTLSNILYDGSIARIGDINNLIIGNSQPRIN